MKMPGLSEHLREHDIARATVLARHAGIMDTRAADASRVREEEVVELKQLAKPALAKLWVFHQAYSAAEEAALRQVALLLVTSDVALKIFGRAATPGSPAVKLLRHKKVHILTPG